MRSDRRKCRVMFALAMVLALPAMSACGGNSAAPPGPGGGNAALAGQWRLVGADSFLPPSGDSLLPDSTVLADGYMEVIKPDSMLLLLAIFTPPAGTGGTQLWIPFTQRGDSVIMHLGDPAWAGHIEGTRLTIHTGAPLGDYFPNPPRLLTFQK